MQLNVLHAVKIPHPTEVSGVSGSGFTTTTHIDENELLAAGDGVDLWDEISSLLPYEIIYFFKWGGDIGAPIELTYSFIGSDFIDYDDNYYDVTGSGVHETLCLRQVLSS